MMQRPLSDAAPWKRKAQHAHSLWTSVAEGMPFPTRTITNATELYTQAVAEHYRDGLMRQAISRRRFEALCELATTSRWNQLGLVYTDDVEHLASRLGAHLGEDCSKQVLARSLNDWQHEGLVELFHDRDRGRRYPPLGVVVVPVLAEAFSWYFLKRCEARSDVAALRSRRSPREDQVEQLLLLALQHSSVPPDCETSEQASSLIRQLEQEATSRQRRRRSRG